MPWNWLSALLRYLSTVITLASKCGKRSLLFGHVRIKCLLLTEYGIITSQYHRLIRTIMDRNNFTFRMAGIIDYMHSKGHDVTQMMSKLHELCRRFTELYGTHPHDIYQQTANALDAITAAP